MEFSTRTSLRRVENFNVGDFSIVRVHYALHEPPNYICSPEVTNTPYQRIYESVGSIVKQWSDVYEGKAPENPFLWVATWTTKDPTRGPGWKTHVDHGHVRSQGTRERRGLGGRRSEVHRHRRTREVAGIHRQHDRRQHHGAVRADRPRDSTGQPVPGRWHDYGRGHAPVPVRLHASVSRLQPISRPHREPLLRRAVLPSRWCHFGEPAQSRLGSSSRIWASREPTSDGHRSVHRDRGPAGGHHGLHARGDRGQPQPGRELDRLRGRVLLGGSRTPRRPARILPPRCHDARQGRGRHQGVHGQGDQNRRSRDEAPRRQSQGVRGCTSRGAASSR